MPLISPERAARRISSSRVQTRSYPPSDDGCEGDGGGEVCGEFVVAGGDASAVFEAAEHALDEIAQLVGLAIEGMKVLAGWVVGDDRPGAAGDQEEPEVVAVIGGITGA